MANNARDGWAEVDGLRTHYLKAGEGNAPVLLLHGGGYDSASLSYKHAIGSISRHHQVFAPDWPGYGQSDKPEIEYSTEYYVGFLGRLMDVLGLKKANLVGISMGGAISLGFSLRSSQGSKSSSWWTATAWEEKCLGGWRPSHWFGFRSSTSWCGQPWVEVVGW